MTVTPADPFSRPAAPPVGHACSTRNASSAVYITIDTEYEAGFTARNGIDTRQANFRRSIAGETRDGSAGVVYQLDRFDRHGLKAVFFVDPMPALLWGVEAITDVIAPILERAHDVQLHLHTEWLALAGAANPLKDRTGANIKDFGFEDQCLLIDKARSLLMAAGAPAPIAFRAGNFGADDNTLRALAALGIAYDSSFSPGFPGSACEVSLGAEATRPRHHCGVIEVPVGCIADIVKGTQHAQLTALSKDELLAAIRHARDSGAESFTVVSHSFELLSRDRRRINKIVRRRFDSFCAGLAALEGVETATYSDNPPRVPEQGAAQGNAPALLPRNVFRASLRAAEQIMANALYAKRRPQRPHPRPQ